MTEPAINRSSKILTGLMLALLIPVTVCVASESAPTRLQGTTTHPAQTISVQPVSVQPISVPSISVPSISEQAKESRMWMIIGEHRLAVTLADTQAARAFAAMLPLTLDMAELNGNEKHVDLPKPLPKNASQPKTLHNGDLMLYGSRTLVIFYLTFNSSYSYTPIGRVDDPSGLAQALGHQGVSVAFSHD